MTLVTKTKKNPPTHYKKRNASHHRKSQHYVKAYLPYLPMLLIVGLGFAINSVWSAHGTVLGASSTYSAAALLQSTNLQRTNDNESALTLNQQLDAAAQAKANDMVARNYWSHNTPDGKTPWTFITSAGYDYQEAGENLAYGFSGASSTVTGWMNSTEHRANILDSDYQDVGFGVANSEDYQLKGPQTVVVALYAEPVSAAANISFTVPSPTVAVGNTNLSSASREPAARLVSRIQVLTGGQAAWSLLAVSFLSGGALAFFVVRHGLRLRALLIEGESYVARHPILDTSVVFVITAGFILTRSSGIIR